MSIVIKMLFDDHAPPHFHAEFQDYRAMININSAELMEGCILLKQLKLVLSWAVLHEKELIENFVNLGSKTKVYTKSVLGN